MQAFRQFRLFGCDPPASEHILVERLAIEFCTAMRQYVYLRLYSDYLPRSFVTAFGDRLLGQLHRLVKVFYVIDCDM